MASYDAGKDEIVAYILDLARNKYKRLSPSSSFRVLDVGACDGKWADLIQGAAVYQKKLPAIRMDAVEAWMPNANQIVHKYDHVYAAEMQHFTYRKGAYDLALFGDVIEHMTVPDAQKVLLDALDRCKEVIVGVPFQYPQGRLYGNPYEVHLQPDLDHELFMERYPGFELLLNARHDYAYYRRAR